MYVIKTEGVVSLMLLWYGTEGWREGDKITLFIEGFDFVETLYFFSQNIISVVLTLLLHAAVQEQMVL